MQNYSFSSVDSIHPPKLQFINNLRALAILLVIFHHAGEVFPNAAFIRIFSQWGKCGVQLFFVMSAFTLCYTGSKLTLWSKSLAGFYIKRLFRIAPMYYIAIIAYYYLSSITSNNIGIWHPGNIEDYTKKNILCNILFLNGLYPAANNNIVPGGWSIGCEMLFYVFFPFILNLTKISRAYLLPVQFFSLFAVGALLFVAKLNGHHGQGGGAFAYYFIANQMSLFVWGILLFFYWQSKTFFKILIWGTIAGVITIIASYYLGFSSWSWIILPPVAGVISCLTAKLISKIHLHKLFPTIGEVSYSMYISHFAFLWIVLEFLKITGVDIDSNLAVILVFATVTILSFFFSKLTYKYIETYFISIGKKIAQMLLNNNNNQQLKQTEVSNAK
ncbi:peptidoglycan/LPS O-acetylase OafA/YrhL [Mucilaginibacter frigoritolerans]|uniref:Peptidoglycan/LPS O-acetylase OafA/YrhL n=1 Tax=Mucilaginibacter frigoritolerans TaxID=652788 RepID=A0A562U5Z7_9SPHI|nr:acyltransferase [Mucilaginibacter frigoritolerans]TWJ00797.1 peptidoglycan/LPS O-acetylase OafA/YrhL [Mucilaginibacter frigoritolerans]